MTKLVPCDVARSVRNLLILIHLLSSEGPLVGGYRPGPGFVTRKPPEIRMTMYAEEDSIRIVSIAQEFPFQKGAFENDFVFRNGSDYVLYGGVQSGAFACEADYPITWKPPISSGNNLNSQLLFIYELRISELTPTSVTPENQRYVLFLYILSTGVNFVSVGLTCSSVEGTPVQETTIQLYRMGKEEIENEGKTVTVYATPPDSTPSKDLPPLVIPCRPSSPNLQLSLQKQISVPSSNQPHKTDTLWSPVKPSGTEITFDPRIGFTIQRRHLGNSIFGLYRCFVTPLEEDSPDGDNMDPNTAQVALVNVVQGTALNPQTVTPSGGGIPFEDKMVVSGQASFAISMDSNTLDFGTVKCCTGKAGKPPTLLVLHCNNPTKCQWDQDSILKDEATTKALNDEVTRVLHPTLGKLPSDCSQTLLLGMSMVVRCTGEDVDVLQHYVTLFTPDAGGPIANRSQKLQSVRKRKPIRRGKLMPVPTEFVQLYEYEKASEAENAGVSRKMLILVGNGFPTPQVGKIVASPNQVISSSGALSLLSGNGDYLVGTTAKTIYFYEWDRDVYFDGEPLSFLCLGIQTLYAVGVHMRVNWKNGTKTGISTNSTLEGAGQPQVEMIMVYLTNNALLPRGTGEGLLVALGEAVIAREDMESVECSMPLAGRSKWDLLSRKVEVVPSVAPKFIEAKEEDVYFYLGELNRKVSCTLQEGTPLPKIKVFRAGHPLKRTASSKEGGSAGPRQNNPRAEGTETLHQDKMLGRLNIKFGVVKHTHQNVFQCRATNVKGVATRTIRVFVIDKPNRAVPIILGVLGLLGVTLLGLGVKHWLHKRRAP